MEIQALLHRAAEAWPGVEVTLERFTAELERRCGSLDELEAICTTDVYLAIAVVDGDPRAASYFDEALAAECERAGKKLRATPDQTTELRGKLHELLFTSNATRHAGLADYAGRGDLRGYLKVITTRELLRAMKRGRKAEPIDSLLDRLEVERAPELSLMRARHGAAVAESMRVALEGLPERERALLRYALVEGWSIDQIGRLYDVHRATAARWLTAARDTLAAAIRAEVATRLALPEDEAESLIALLRSRIDISLERIL